MLLFLVKLKGKFREGRSTLISTIAWLNSFSSTAFYFFKKIIKIRRKVGFGNSIE